MRQFFSDSAIEFCLTLKVLFGLALRQTTGLVASVLKMAELDWPVPDYTTLCRRQKALAVSLGGRPSKDGVHLLVDSTGMKMSGEGEWKTRRNGRPWMKEGLGVQARNEALRAIKRFGRTIWKKWSGYHRRSLVETKMHCFKLLGHRVASRTFDRQITEFKVRSSVLNCFSKIGIHKTICVA